MVGIAQRAKLTFQQDGLALLVRLIEEVRRVRDHRANLLRQTLQIRHQLVHINRRLMIQVLQQHILLHQRDFQPLAQQLLVVQLADLNAHLRVFIRIERRNAAFGGAERTLAQALFLQLVKCNVIGHHHLAAVGNHQLGHRHAAGRERFQFAQQRLDVQRHARPDDVDHVLMENAGRQQMQRKFAVFIDDGVTRIRAALEADNHVAFFCKQVGHLALAFVAPVSAYNGTNHLEHPP